MANSAVQYDQLAREALERNGKHLQRYHHSMNLGWLKVADEWLVAANLSARAATSGFKLAAVMRSKGL